MERILTRDELARVVDAGFNKYGLRYPLDDLKEIVPTDLSMEAVSKYTDAITFAKVGSNDKEFFQRQLTPIPPGVEVKVNITGIGNLAYIALNMEDEETKKKAQALYEQILSSYVPTK